MQRNPSAHEQRRSAAARGPRARAPRAVLTHHDELRRASRLERKPHAIAGALGGPSGPHAVNSRCAPRLGRGPHAVMSLRSASRREWTSRGHLASALCAPSGPHAVTSRCAPRLGRGPHAVTSPARSAARARTDLTRSTCAALRDSGAGLTRHIALHSATRARAHAVTSRCAPRLGRGPHAVTLRCALCREWTSHGHLALRSTLRVNLTRSPRAALRGSGAGLTTEQLA